ncbi:MAG: hypothetical protein WC028_11405 [Candidatus Obscuribacterales bacterium]
MPMLSSWWSKISVLKRVLIALGLVFTLLSVCVYLFGGRLANFALLSFLAERSKQDLQELPFSRQAWLSDRPSGSRHAMARWLEKNHVLLGMTEAEVKQFLGFGQFKSDSKAHGVDNTTFLIMRVSSWHCEYGAHFDVTIEDGRVIEASFSEEY